MNGTDLRMAKPTFWAQHLARQTAAAALQRGGTLLDHHVPGARREHPLSGAFALHLLEGDYVYAPVLARGAPRDLAGTHAKARSPLTGILLVKGVVPLA